MKKSIPMSVANPTIGLYSRTNAEQGTELLTQLVDAQNAIIQGQQPVSSWNAAVKTWRSSGGDKMRSEYEKALADSK